MHGFMKVNPISVTRMCVEISGNFSGEFLQNIVGKRELRKSRLSNSHTLLIGVKDLLYILSAFLVWIPFGTADLSVMFLRNC
jgi:hypothetical protein